MRLVVIGSGLLGTATAYFLRRRGYEVLVVDRQSGAGMETSLANGAMLTPSMPEPWNAPGCWRTLLSSLGREDSPMQLRFRALPSLLGWGTGFLRNSRPEPFKHAALSNLRLALHSLKVMQLLREETKVQYSRCASGTLRVFRDPEAMARAIAWARQLESENLPFRALSQAQTVALEPALEPIAHDLVGSLHYEVDETGDAHRFCTALASRAQAQGVKFRFGVEIEELELRDGRVCAATSCSERFVGDQYIIAAGSYSALILKRLGISLPVVPVKGYSITLRADRATPALGIPVIDDRLHVAVVPLGSTIRIAGTAEFAGYDRTLNPHRVRNLLRLLGELLPRGQLDLATAAPWCGLRPMSVDGMPVIGRTPIPNVFINTGHGHLGWTMAAGSAQLAVDLIAGARPALDPAPFAFARFGRTDGHE